MRRADVLAGIICVCFVALALLTTRQIPVFEASDEAAHFLYVHHLLEEGTLPLIPTRAEIAQIAARGDVVGQWSIETHQPPAYYAIGALLVSGTARTDITDYLRPNTIIFTRGISAGNANKWLHLPGTPQGDTHTAVMILRAYSLALSTLTLWVIYRAGKLVFGSAGVALTALALVASIQTYISIGASVNNDNLVTLLYSAGVYQSLRMWRYGIRPRDVAVISALLGIIVLTKITGAALFAVVYGALVLGAWTGHYRFKQAVGVIVISGGTAALIAGWWYLRNWSLYGDPLALSATQALWGRQFANPDESGDLWVELSRIGRSFWMMTGHLHQPVYGATWVYLYALGVTLAGIVGLVFSGRKMARKAWDSGVLLLALAAVLPVILLLTGTRSVDISYGRLLFPALIGFAPLLVYGWWQLAGRLAPVLILPLAGIAIIAPVTYLPDAYPLLVEVDAVPGSAVPVNVRTENGLTVLAYERLTDRVMPGGEARFHLYLQNPDPRNPILVSTLLDPLATSQGEAARGIRLRFPGSAPTDALIPGTIYRTGWVMPVSTPAVPGRPRLLGLQLGWQTILSTEYLPVFTIEDNAPQDSLVLAGAPLIDPRYTADAVPYTTSATFGDAIMLTGYGYSEEALSAGDTLNVALNWRTLAPPDTPEEYVLTVQLLDARGDLAGQIDGDLAGYPSYAWVQTDTFTETRTLLTVTPETPAGEYRVAVGWYRLSDFARLPVEGEHARDSLWFLPVSVRVEPHP